MNLQDKIQETLSKLKDFQLKTVDYVFEQLYDKGRDKMLIADEVGLGKTIVARGIIAKGFSRFEAKPGKRTFNVVYICSNMALVKQNLKKLNFTDADQAIDIAEEDDRVTGLAYVKPKDELEFPFRIKAFTPATSFNDKTHAGKAEERILLYRLLYSYADFRGLTNRLKWILKGNNQIHDDNWQERIEFAEGIEDGRYTINVKKINSRVYSEFRKALEEKVKPKDLPHSFAAANLSYEVKYWTLLKNLCRLEIRKNNYKNFRFCKELISCLRFILSRVCITFLQADIFVLDEFQRYKKLIEKSGANDEEEEKITPAIQLARDVFASQGSKILMLSATPFKPFTGEFDEVNGEVHYAEFITVLRFLMADKPGAFWKDYEHDRKMLFGFLRHPDVLEKGLDEAVAIKNRIEELYRACMVRTEKLLVSDNKDALIKQVNKPISIQPEDISDFVVLDQVTLLLNKKFNTSLQVPLEYVKSCPFALSFLDHYQHKEKIREFIFKCPELYQLLKKMRHGWVNLDNIHNYKPLIPSKATALPNAKLRLLLDETVLEKGWQYIWIPPSVPYYELDGAYAGSRGYSKTLLFSSWKMVPRMVASLVSYEAERLSIGNPKSVSDREKKEAGKNRHYYFHKKRRSPRPQFTFKVLKEDDEPKQMNNFMLTYPCLYLTELYDPAVNIMEDKSLELVKAELKQKLLEDFNRLQLNDYVTGQGDWQKWYWLAPLLLDKAGPGNELVSNWFSKGLPHSELLMDTESTGTDIKDESSGKEKHFKNAGRVFAGGKIAAGKLNKEQVGLICSHLADLAIGSPAICYLRSQKRYMDLSADLLNGSFNVASAFLTMFNKPESIAVVRLHTPQSNYWEAVLQYMTDGNIQAMLDEFIYLLINGEGIKGAADLSNFISDILSVRTASPVTEDFNTFVENIINGTKTRRSMRSHYAVDFGTQSIQTAKGAGRQINIRQAFNSPFRPFVLASTSIGQEGLDFHFYCKKIFHWNLPANPIDFEQREGRIHRYQGLVIRLNVGQKYSKVISYKDKTHNLWIELFNYAAKEKNDAKLPCDLVPFWHTESVDDIKIERFVPLYPFSSDKEKFNNLIRILTFYRLTFGQPRQQELIDALHNEGFSDEMIKSLYELIINLSPVVFQQEVQKNQS